MSPRPRIPDRRERILIEASRLVLERGFDAMTMQSVAEAVGIGKGAIYREFSSKDELLETLLREASERVIAAVHDELDGGALPSLAAGYQAWTRSVLGEPLLRAGLLDELGVLGDQVARVSDAPYRDRHAQVVAWIRELAAAGRLVEGVNPDHLALALSSTTIGLLSAARTLGPLTDDAMGGALDVIERILREIER